MKISEDGLEELLAANSCLRVSSKSVPSKPVKKDVKAPKIKKSSGQSDLELRFAADIRNLGFPKPQREVRFYPPRKWRLDFYWPEFKLAVEIDGGTYTHGQVRKGQVQRSGHLTPKGYYSDCTKGNHVAMIGATLLRADSDMVTKGEIYPQLEQALKIRGWDGKREKWTWDLIE